MSPQSCFSWAMFQIQSFASYGYNKNVLIEQKIMVLSFYIGKKEFSCGQLYHLAVVNSNLNFSEYNLPEDTTLAGSSSFGLLTYYAYLSFCLSMKEGNGLLSQYDNVMIALQGTYSASMQLMQDFKK